MTPLHIIIVSTINSRKGGTEYIATRLAEKMLCHRHRVTIAHADDDEKVFAFPLPRGVELLPYCRSQEHANIQRLREKIQQTAPDVCLCMQSSSEHLFWAVTLLGTGIPFIYSERTSPYVMSSPPRWNSAGRLAAMSGADAIHLLMPEYKETIPACFREKVRIIGNPAPEGVTRFANPAVTCEGRYRLVSLGRLVETKHPILLAEAFEYIADTEPEWDLHFWGSGEEEPSLKKYIERHPQLHNRIFLHGDTNSPLEIYPTGHLYCSASQHEGFPNAVLEALVCGLPVVGFASCTGLSNLVRNDVNGFLAPEMTAVSLAEALLRLMRNATLRDALGKNAQRIREQYTQETVFAQWETLFGDMAKRKGATVMDGFQEEPFASRARLSAVARREWLLRDFGMPVPYSFAWWKHGLKTMSLKFMWNGMRQAQNFYTKTHHVVSLAAHLARATTLFLSKNFAYKRYLYRQIQKTVGMLPAQQADRTADFIAYAVRHIPDLENKAVCCIGCRDEKELDAWRSFNIANAVGVDLMSVNKDIHIMDMHSMTFHDDSFDIVYACHSLEHSAKPQKAIDEFTRIVKNNGYIAIEIPTNFIPNNVDIHSFENISAVHQLFSNKNNRVIYEKFIPASSPENIIGEDIFRIIYQIHKG